MLEFFDYIKKINLKIKFLSTDIFTGEYASTFKGRGLEFEEVREYITGDDIKTIDWNTSAKTGKLHTKIFREERELTVVIMLDISGSMHFGSKWAFKSELATEIAALLSYTALKNNDKVSLLLFDNKVEKFIPPRKGKNHIWNIIKTIVNTDKLESKTNINEAIKFAANAVKKRSILFLISDFFCDENFFATMKPLKKRFDFVPVIIRDPLEKSFKTKYSSKFILKDIESKKIYETKPDFSQEDIEEINRGFNKINVKPLNISTDKPYLPEIVKYFRERRRVF
jgi:uncharacterized protein (DUF58 family)